MKCIKLSLTVMVLFLTVLMTSAIAYGEDGAKVKNSSFGIGLGIPYGGIGVNFETGKSFAFTAGAGIFPSEKNSAFGWSAGARFYLSKPTQDTRLRISCLYGTVAFVAKQGLSGTITKIEDTVTGFAPGIGIKGEHWDFDLIFPVGYEIPKGYKDQSTGIKISIGYRW